MPARTFLGLCLSLSLSHSLQETPIPDSNKLTFRKQVCLSASVTFFKPRSPSLNLLSSPFGKTTHGNEQKKRKETRLRTVRRCQVALAKLSFFLEKARKSVLSEMSIRTFLAFGEGLLGLKKVTLTRRVAGGVSGLPGNPCARTFFFFFFFFFIAGSAVNVANARKIDRNLRNTSTIM